MVTVYTRGTSHSVPVLQVSQLAPYAWLTPGAPLPASVKPAQARRPATQPRTATQPYPVTTATQSQRVTTTPQAGDNYVLCTILNPMRKANHQVSNERERDITRGKGTDLPCNYRLCLLHAEFVPLHKKTLDLLGSVWPPFRPHEPSTCWANGCLGVFS